MVSKMNPIRQNIIEINNLKMQAFHGVLPQEHIVGNLFSISISLQTDFSMAMDNDSLDDTISYAEVAEVIKEEMLIPSKLLEHVGGRIVKHIQDRWGSKIKGIDLRIEKLSPPIGLDIDNCAVRIIIND